MQLTADRPVAKVTPPAWVAYMARGSRVHHASAGGGGGGRWRRPHAKHLALAPSHQTQLGKGSASFSVLQTV